MFGRRFARWGLYEERLGNQFRIRTDARCCVWSTLKMKEAVNKESGYRFLDPELTREPNFGLLFIY